ncbi:hypothetical protein INR49_017971 [Caranx melampygus]|nr:hypothetical protein INR49_017971 [Caranx melampygus]
MQQRETKDLRGAEDEDRAVEEEEEEEEVMDESEEEDREEEEALPGEDKKGRKDPRGVVQSLV